jgi:hypothetical protein
MPHSHFAGVETTPARARPGGIINYYQYSSMRINSICFAIAMLCALGMYGCTDASTTPGDNNNGIDTTSTSTQTEWKCGSYKGHTLYTGPKGGCYYYNGSNNKTYVDHSNCNC